MAEQKTLRLNKVARELNVGISTIVEFLNSKGHKIEANPNAKIDENLYEVLCDEFQAEKKDKEKSKKTAITREKRETVTLDSTKRDKKDKPDIEQEEEILIKNVQASPEIIKPKVQADVKVSVVGKIDLESLKKNKNKDKTEAESKPEINLEKEETTQEPSVEDKPNEETESPAEIETIKAEVEKLSGPKVLGKINLPIEKEIKKPDVSSNEDKKRKRKRIKKVDVEKAAKETPVPQGKKDFHKHKKQQPKVEKAEVSQEEIQREIRETLAKLSGQGKSKSSKLRREKRELMSQRREEEIQRKIEVEKVLKLTEFVTVSDLAKMMNVQPTQVISACMSLGIFASINQRLDAETITIVAEEFGFTVQFVTADIQETIQEEEDKETDLVPRPPIVTVMGHVDHGKTSLLDYIRKSNVIAGEAGGITQHIGAYGVELENGKKITFLDTPGHEAFTAMRARGAKVTDVAIIVIAADDSVMPQTKEAISHAQAAGVPMVFAINKIDKPDAKPDKIREDLANMNILVEEWGGKYQCHEISAKKGIGVNELLDKVLLEAEILDLKANPNRKAKGTVIESMLDKGRGFVATVLVSTGTLKIGDVLLAGAYSGKVKAMFNERGQPVEAAGPSTPVSILGLDGAPNAGDIFNVMDDEREARNIATRRLQLIREQGMRTNKHITLDEIGRRLAIGDFKELNLIVKGDVDGSVEALCDSLLKLSTDRISVRIVHKGVGAISESDVLLASASDAIIVGFQVRPTSGARKLAETEEIDIRMYSIIYKAIEEIKDAMEGMLSPEVQEKITGTAEIRQIFKVSKVGTVAGCFVMDGKIFRTSQVRVIRDGIVIYTGKLGSLKHYKDDVKEMSRGQECGLNIDKFNDIKVGDIIEAFEEVEVKRTL